jgi:hypothetical protein
MTPDELLLLEQVVSAHRERTVDGVIKSHPAWHDLDAAGRVAAYDETLRQRAVERAADAGGESSIVKAVLARLRSR